MAEPTNGVPKPATPEPTSPPEAVPTPKPFGVATPPESQAPVAKPGLVKKILGFLPFSKR